MSLDVDRINAGLRGTLFHEKLHHFTVTDSTNTRALAAAHAGAEAGQVCIADRQTAGRGRGGHTWHSEPDGGLYLSVLFQPALHADAALHVSLGAALAARSAVMAACSYAADIRWPNDIVTPPGTRRARKLGGILTESALNPDGRLRYAVVGIGLNLNQEHFSPELESLATSLRLELGIAVPRELAVIHLLRALEAEVTAIQAEAVGQQLQPDLNERFLSASTWVRGKRVRVAEDESYTGTTDGLTPAGLLRVRSDDGRLRIVRHGGVREM